MERVSRRNVYTGKGRRKRPFDGANPLFRFAINFWKRNRGTHERKHTMEEDPCEKKWGGGEGWRLRKERACGEQRNRKVST